MTLALTFTRKLRAGVDDDGDGDDDDGVVVEAPQKTKLEARELARLQDFSGAGLTGPSPCSTVAVEDGTGTNSAAL
jgi:hypothetical protein